MGLTKNQAIEILTQSHRTTQYVALVLLTADRFSHDSARRLKYMALISLSSTRFDLTDELEPIVDSTVLSWESLDHLGKAFVAGDLNISQFNALVEKFGKPHQAPPHITPGLKTLLLGFVKEKE